MLIRWLAFVVVVTFLPRPLWAEVPEDVTPPRLLVAPRVPYPQHAAGRAEVVLVMTIDDRGEVVSVEVERGSEPFATTAATAARGWRFVPARRNGRPIRSRILRRIEFAPLGAMPPETPAVKEGEAQGVVDVTVEGELQLPPSVTSLEREEVRRLPGAFGDPFRAIESMPGVTPITSGLPFFFVRGAPPGNIGYFVDGVRVPYLFHVGAGPAVIHPAFVDRVALYSGGYPARFGRYAGAVVSATTKNPDPTWHGEGNLRLVDAGALVEGGFADGRGTALIGGRYAYTGLLLSLLSPTATVRYRDYQARISYDVTDRDRISLVSFGSYDYLSETRRVDDATEVENIIFGTEFYRVDARVESRLRGGGNLLAAITWGYDRSRVLQLRNGDGHMVSSRLRFRRPVTKDLSVNAGMNLQLDRLRVDPLKHVDLEDPTVITFAGLFPPRTDAGLGIWTGLSWAVSRRLEVSPELRMDGYFDGDARALAVDPRLRVVARPVEGLRLLHAVGVASQPPSFAVPAPGLAPADLEDGVQRAVQASAGVELSLPEKLQVSATGFVATQLDMTDAIGIQQDLDAGTVVPRSMGSSKGLEVHLRRALTERLGGFISYTLSRTSRRLGRRRFLAATDRPHVLHAALTYDLGRWRTGMRFTLFSGAPNADRGDVAPGRPARDPAFYRLDFRVEKRWSLGGTGWLSLVIEALNATFNREVVRGQPNAPIAIPSIGLEGGF